MSSVDTRRFSDNLDGRDTIIINAFQREKGLMREVRQRASRRRKSGLSTPHNAGEIVSRLNDLGSDELAAVEVTVVKSPVGISITEALARKIGLERLGLWNQDTSYKNSRQIPDTFGTGMGSDNRSATKCDSVEVVENIEPDFGGASRDRTDDLIVANDALSQLSYSPTRTQGSAGNKVLSRFYQRQLVSQRPGMGAAPVIQFARETILVTRPGKNRLR